MPATTGEFNPYQKWFGIRGDDRPDHYRLLGLTPFEHDTETISHAADQRIEYVRGLSLGQHQDVAQRILNELAAAKICLLTPDKKERYDRELRGKQPPLAAIAASLAAALAPPPVPPMPPVVFPVGEPHRAPPRAIEVPVFSEARSWETPSRSRGFGRSAPRSAALYVASILISILAVVSAGLYFFHHVPLETRATDTHAHSEPSTKMTPMKKSPNRLPPAVTQRRSKTRTSSARIEGPGSVAEASSARPRQEQSDGPELPDVRVVDSGAVIIEDGEQRHLTVAAPNAEPTNNTHVPNTGVPDEITISAKPPAAPVAPATTPRLAPAFDIIWIRDPTADAVAWEWEFDLDERMYAQRDAAHAREGLRPACIVGYHDKQPRQLFAATWLGDGVPAYSVVAVDAFDNTEAFREKLRPDHCPIWIDSCIRDAQPRFTQVFAKPPTRFAWECRNWYSLKQFDDQAVSFERLGYRLMQRRTSVSAGLTSVRGIWISDGKRSRSEANLTAEQLSQRLTSLERGWRPSCLDVTGQGDARRYVLVTTNADPQLEWKVSTALSAGRLRTEAARLRKRGYVPRSIAVE